jgi:hypothetical protein
MQDIRRITVRIILRRASLGRIQVYGVDCSGLNKVQRAETLNKLRRPKHNNISLSSSGDITICMGHLFLGVTLDSTMIFLILTMHVPYSYWYTKLSSEGDI